MRVVGRARVDGRQFFFEAVHPHAALADPPPHQARSGPPPQSFQGTHNVDQRCARWRQDALLGDYVSGLLHLLPCDSVAAHRRKHFGLILPERGRMQLARKAFGEVPHRLVRQRVTLDVHRIPLLHRRLQLCGRHAARRLLRGSSVGDPRRTVCALLAFCDVRPLQPHYGDLCRKHNRDREAQRRAPLRGAHRRARTRGPQATRHNFEVLQRQACGSRRCAARTAANLREYHVESHRSVQLERRASADASWARAPTLATPALHLARGVRSAHAEEGCSAHA
mmetsp:Transcript_31424/g.86400  ORF Transcript_31424/g.86400 Transcript_31424/m.86400 type:complete len:281 (-) Transcript_31424:420-1262(-)